jgi:hypothetical protein
LGLTRPPSRSEKGTTIAGREPAREDGCGTGPPDFWRKQSVKGGSRKNRDATRTRSPMPQTPPWGLMPPAASRCTSPTGAPRGGGRSSTRPLGDRRAHASNQCASGAGWIAPDGAQAGHGDPRGRGRCRYTRRNLSGGAGCQACRCGWAQIGPMRARGRRFRAGYSAWLGDAGLGGAASAQFIGDDERTHKNLSMSLT